MSVSVIIPTYNRAHLICEAIDSVINQTYQDFEIIVVDDGSTDETSEVLKKYRDEIIYVKQENKGPGAARNRGLAHAEGSYIAFLDSDDIWFNYKLELQMAIMEKLSQIGFLCSDFCILKDSGKSVRYGLRTWHKELRRWEEVFEKTIRFSSLNLPVVSPYRDFNILMGNLYHPLLHDPYVPTCSAILRSECLNGGIKFPERISLYEDWEFFARLSLNYDAAFLDVETFINRGHGDEGRLTHCSASKHAENRLGLIERVWKVDDVFSEKYGQEIARIEANQLLILAKGSMLESQPEVARRIISRWEQLGVPSGRYKALFFKALTYLPRVDKLLIIIRYIHRVFLSIKRIGSSTI